MIGRLNQVWALDITYIPMARGFIYLTAVIDWFTRHEAYVNQLPSTVIAA